VKVPLTVLSFGAGSVIFGGILRLDFSGGAYADGTDVLQLFANSGGRSGDFTSVIATGLGAGQYATFSPSTGSISIVPEPASWALALAGLAGAGCMLRRCPKQA
jgi:hypothetical protein